MIRRILPVLLILHYVVANFKSVLLAAHVLELLASVVFQLLIVSALRSRLTQTLRYPGRLWRLRKLELFVSLVWNRFASRRPRSIVSAVDIWQLRALAIVGPSKFESQRCIWSLRLAIPQFDYLVIALHLHGFIWALRHLVIVSHLCHAILISKIWSSILWKRLWIFLSCHRTAFTWSFAAKSLVFQLMISLHLASFSQSEDVAELFVRPLFPRGRLSASPLECSTGGSWKPKS